MKIKITRTHILVFVGIVLTIGIGFLIYKGTRPVTTIYYKGQAFTFREDVREANKIEVVPSEKLLYDDFWGFKIQNMTIMYKTASTVSNQYYVIQAFTIANKFSMVYSLGKHPLMVQRTFDSQEIDSYENITREDRVLKIILVAPDFTNKTYVKAGGNKIYIYAKDYKDFDLAVIKTIMTAMNVTA